MADDRAAALQLAADKKRARDYWKMLAANFYDMSKLCYRLAQEVDAEGSQQFAAVFVELAQLGRTSCFALDESILKFVAEIRKAPLPAHVRESTEKFLGGGLLPKLLR